ncbi:hypothetical protein RvY_15619 [Ramazzottius varieornatus]|uniref:Uncharacterized protein n=1 Tax=Ramazzottius varieornatus TaxID=947166 RepID=A0A1D1W2B4_RAMVA|nr:hypothetical protein RvY_15619 [Ramazzottius varieornatus]
MRKKKKKLKSQLQKLGARPSLVLDPRQLRLEDLQTGITLPSSDSEIFHKAQAPWTEHLRLSAREYLLVLTDVRLLNSSLIDAGLSSLEKVTHERQMPIRGLDYARDMKADPRNNSLMKLFMISVSG